MKAILLGVAAGALVAGSALAADVKGEIATAENHANLAAAATDIAGVHMHLHHTLNCIAGPKGAGFDASQVDPCSGRGNGAMPDATDPAMKTALQAAADEASKGIGETNLATAQADAKSTSAMLAAIK
ncbi:MAG: hypothetical protein WBQ17_12025 [Rhizomicrobium sp.]